MSLTQEKIEKKRSNREVLGKVYNAILDVAKPGDLIFLTTTPEADFPFHRKLYRSWQGISPTDKTRWHTAIFTEGKKESKGAQIRPHFVHASQEKGVVEVHTPPAFFSQKYDENAGSIKSARMEIVQNPDLTPEQREQIVLFSRQQIGKPFDDPDWRRDIPTYAFGLPSKPLGKDRIACHGIAFQAYAEAAGWKFPHGLDSAPFFNLAHWIGHPLGHPRDHVNLDRLYLRDHHLYDDPRFKLVLSISQNMLNKEFQVVTNPEKYSWNSK